MHPEHFGIQGMKRIDAIILAAGLSRRMGEPKLLLPWDQTTVLGATLANVLASNVQQVVVVTGGYRPKITPIIEHSSRITAVHNPDFATGEMLSSLKVGIAALSAETDGCLIMLGDMPLLMPETINLVAAALQTHELVAPVYAGRRGHPVGFGRNIFPQLLNLPPDGAPRDLMRAQRDQLHLLEVDTESILIDLDTREAYETWRPR